MKHIKEFAQLFENTQELTQEQKDWLDKCTQGDWLLNEETGEVDIWGGDFDCDRQALTDFKGVRFGHVTGYFMCHTNRLTSLEGAPREVGGGFWCTGNKLTSLVGAPQIVGGDFRCNYNKLTSLEGLPGGFSVGGDFDCCHNELTSLEGAPQRAGGDFDCEDNPITEWVIQVILIEMSDDGITLEQAVSDLWNDIPEEDRIYLAKHHPDLPPDEKRGYEALARHKKRLI